MPTKAIAAIQGWLPGTASEARLVRQVLTLASGTFGAQLVAVAVAPFLTRIYSPEAFGVFGVLIGLGSVLAVVAGLKYELAIVLESSEADALDALRLTLAITLVFALVLLALAVVGGNALGRLLEIPDHSLLLVVVPLFVLFFGWSQALSFWATRHERWAVQAQGELGRNLGTAGCQLAVGLLAAGPLGLMVGRIVGELGMLLRLWGGAGLRCGGGGSWSGLLAGADGRRLRRLTVQHRELALYQTPRAFLHSAVMHLPALLLAACASPAVAGLYWFAARLLRISAGMAGNAVRRVFFKGAVTLHQAGECPRSLLIRVTLLLGLAGLLPVLVLAAEGPALFAFAFGETWRAAGAYARWLAVWSWFDLMAAPAGMLVSVYAVQRPFFCADLLAAVTGAAALVFAAASNRYELAIGLYAAVMAGRSAYGIGLMLMRTAREAR